MSLVKGSFFVFCEWKPAESRRISGEQDKYHCFIQSEHYCFGAESGRGHSVGPTGHISRTRRSQIRLYLCLFSGLKQKNGRSQDLHEIIESSQLPCIIHLNHQQSRYWNYSTGITAHSGKAVRSIPKTILPQNKVNSVIRKIAARLSQIPAFAICHMLTFPLP